MRYITILVLVLLTAGAHAQLRYSGTLEGGLVNGSFQTKGFLQTSHGLSYRQWVIALGTGIDYYRYRTVPVYAEVRRELGKKNIKPFALAAIGINVAWPNELQKQQENDWWQTTPTTFHNGWYTRAGGGVMINAGKQLQALVNVTVSYKTFSMKYREIIVDPWPQPSEPVDKTAEYRMPRLGIGFGLMF